MSLPSLSSSAFCLRTKALAKCHLKTIQFLLRYHDGHASLARETRRDPVDVDTDRASMGWTNWDLAVDEGVRVKEEKAVFKALRTLLAMSLKWIHLRLPRRNGSPTCCLQLPCLLCQTPAMPLGLSHPDDEDTLERALEAEMDLSYWLPGGRCEPRRTP